jgi:hypothetical protein
MSEHEVRKAQLAAAYANNGGSCVAFIDESYLTPSFAAAQGSDSLYLMAAYVVPVDDLDTMRDELPNVVGATYWHSTEANQSAAGRGRIRDLTTYIGEGTETIVVCIRRPVANGDANGELARRAVFTELLRSLGHGQHCTPVSLVVFEERKGATNRNADARTIREARSDVRVRRMHVLPMSPAAERLLWLADMASFALYQRYAKGRDEYAAPFIERVRRIET